MIKMLLKAGVLGCRGVRTHIINSSSGLCSTLLMEMKQKMLFVIVLAVLLTPDNCWQNNYSCEDKYLRLTQSALFSVDVNTLPKGIWKMVQHMICRTWRQSRDAVCHPSLGLRTKESDRLSRLLLPRLITLLFLESMAKLRLSEEYDPLELEQPPSSRWPFGVSVQILGSGERVEKEIVPHFAFWTWVSPFSRMSPRQQFSVCCCLSLTVHHSDWHEHENNTCVFMRLTRQLDRVVLLTFFKVGGGVVVIRVGAVGITLETQDEFPRRLGWWILWLGNRPIPQDINVAQDSDSC